MSDSEMTDLADQVNDIEVPLTAQNKAQRKRDDEVNSLLGTDMAGLAKQVMDVEIAQVPPRPSPPSESHDHQDLDSSSSPLSPLAIDQWISESEDDARTPEEDNASLERALRELEEKRAKSRPKAPKMRNYGRIGRSGRVTKLAIRGGPPRGVRDGSRVHTETRNYGRIGSNGGIIKRNMVIRGGRPRKVRSETKVGGNSGATETKLVIRGGRPERVQDHSKVNAASRVGSSGGLTKLAFRGGRPRKMQDDSKMHADRRASKAPKEACRKRLAPAEPSYKYDFDAERMVHEVMQQRDCRSWSTEAVANFEMEKVDRYAFFR